MSIATEIQRLAQAKADIKAAIEEKGVEVGNGTIDTYAAKISEITGGGGSGGVPAGYHSVTFMNGDDVLFERLVLNGDDCPDPVTQGRIETPTKESTPQYNYTHSGWTSVDGGTADSNALKNITEDKVVYSAYTESVHTYTVTFYDGDTIIKTEQVAYGGSSTYAYEKENYMFLGWTPKPTNITGNLDCYGAWEELVVEVEEITDSWEDIVASINDGTYKSKYKIGNYKKIDSSKDYYATMQIAAFDTDDLADGSGKAPTTWIASVATFQNDNSTKQRMNPALETIYSWDPVPSWKTTSANVWETVQLYYEKSEANAKWVITATTAGTLSIAYSTILWSYLAFTLKVNGTAVVSNPTANGTYTVEMSEGEQITVEANDVKMIKNSHVTAKITFSSTGTFDVSAEVSDTPTQGDKVGYVDGTGCLGGWVQSEMRSYLKNTYMPTVFPNVLKNNIKQVNKVSYSAIGTGGNYGFKDVTSAEDVWLPSYREVYGGETFEKSGPIYNVIFTDNASRCRKNYSNLNKAWWLRSAIDTTLFTSNNPTYYKVVSSDGSEYQYGANDTSTNIILGFCI